jgi:hypothetical protein
MIDRRAVNSFTAEQLLALAHARDYAFLTPELLRQWVRRGVLPAAREVRQDGQRRYGVWTAYDAEWLLSACILHEMHSHADVLRASLTLLGYPVAGGWELVRVRAIAQLEAMHLRIVGRTGRGDGILSEQEDNAVYAQIDCLLDKCAITDQLVWGVEDTLQAHDYDEIPLLHPDLDAGVPRAALRQNMWPLITHRTDAGIPDEAVYPRSDIPAEQVKEMHRTLAGDILVQIAKGPCGAPCDRFSLADALEEVKRAGETDYFFATERAFYHIISVMESQSVMSGIRGAPLVSVESLLQPFAGTWRFLLAAPVVFPLVAYLLAAHLLFQRTGTSTHLAHNLVAIALPRLAQRRKGEPVSDDTLLAILFSVMLIPSDR